MKNPRIYPAIILAVFLLSNLSFAQNITIGGGSGNTKTTVSYRGIKIGEKVDEVKFEKVFNAPQSAVSLKDLKNKIIILEFWATWCGPCLPALDHLNSLKVKFPDQLEVISVLHDSEERLQRFMKNKPSSMWHVADPEMSLNRYFPHRAVPHTVVINKEGKVAAITSPTELNEEIISKLINNQSVKLPTKDDKLDDGFDMSKDYFPKPESTEYAFDIQPAIPGGFPMVRRVKKGNWAERRLTMLNQPISLLYKTIYQFTEIRVIYEGVDRNEFDHRKTKAIYCIDIVVPKGKESELYSYAKNELAKLDFDVKARVEKRKLEVGILTCFDKEKLLAHKNKSSQETNFAMMNASQYKRKGVSIDEMLKGFLESFGHGRMPLINETGIDGLFDFDITLDLEDKATLKNALAEYGLKLAKEERETEMLVLYR